VGWPIIKRERVSGNRRNPSSIVRLSSCDYIARKGGGGTKLEPYNIVVELRIPLVDVPCAPRGSGPGQSPREFGKKHK